MAHHQCGNITFKGITFMLLWDEKTKLVYVRDPHGTEMNSGDAKSQNQQGAKDVALKMLEIGGYQPPNK